MRKNKSTIGQEIIEGLEDFVGALKRGEPLEKRFTCRQVHLDLERTERTSSAP